MLHLVPKTRYTPWLARIVLFCGACALSFDFAAAQSHIIGEWPVPAVPAENPQDPDKEKLGKALYWDEQLSADLTMSCGTCHIPSAGGSDPRTMQHPLGSPNQDGFGSPGVILQDKNGNYEKHPYFGVGRQITTRIAPSVFGAAFFDQLFWDARATEIFKDEDGNVISQEFATLESVSVEPPVSPVEMGLRGIEWTDVVARLAPLNALALATDLPSDVQDLTDSTYDELFEQAFQTPGVGVTRERVAMVLAQYMRTLIPNQAPIDSGMVYLPPEVKQGFDLFNEMQFGGEMVARCTQCHASALNGDLRIELTATETFRRANDNLLSGGQLAGVLPNPPDLPLAKTPSLRNIALFPRVESHGKFAGLRDALANHFFQDDNDPQITFGANLEPDEKAAVVAFFDALTDPRVANETYPFDRPTLYSERVPFQSNHLGTGVGAPGESVPVMIANAPPKIGNAHFKLGVGMAKGGATAHLYVADTAMSVIQNNIHWEIDPTTAQLVDSVTLAGDGVGTSHLPIPDDQTLVGTTVYFQWLVEDADAPGGFATSQAARMSYF